MFFVSGSSFSGASRIFGFSHFKGNVPSMIYSLALPHWCNWMYAVSLGVYVRVAVCVDYPTHASALDCRRWVRSLKLFTVIEQIFAWKSAQRQFVFNAASYLISKFCFHSLCSLFICTFLALPIPTSYPLLLTYTCVCVYAVYLAFSWDLYAVSEWQMKVIACRVFTSIKLLNSQQTNNKVLHK